jgi:hypothetical protein
LYFHKTLFNKRPINVELTAGGGGNKSAARNKKIAEKNEALNEERVSQPSRIILFLDILWLAGLSSS